MNMMSDGTMIGLFVVLMFFLVVLGILSTLFWIWMIVDCATRKKLSDGERIAWILVLVFLHALGAVVYYFAVKRNS